MSDAIIVFPRYQEVINVVLDGVNSENSKRAYRTALNSFFTWLADKDNQPICKATVQAYKTSLRQKGESTAKINIHLAAVRKLAVEGLDNGWIDAQTAAGVAKIKDLPSRGVRAGNWLTIDQAKRLLDIDTSTLKGLRDRAILAVLLGAGLRRSEVVALRFDHIQEREGRWIIIDLVGKGGRVRSVPIPTWAKTAINAWAAAAGIDSGHIFHNLDRAGKGRGKISGVAILDIVRTHAERAGLGTINPHDLRRTFARLTFKGGAGLDQVQLSLGHASLQTTQRYLGLQQELTPGLAPCDYLELG